MLWVELMPIPAPRMHTWLRTKQSWDPILLTMELVQRWIQDPTNTSENQAQYSFSESGRRQVLLWAVFEPERMHYLQLLVPILPLHIACGWSQREGGRAERERDNRFLNFSVIQTEKKKKKKHVFCLNQVPIQNK